MSTRAERGGPLEPQADTAGVARRAFAVTAPFDPTAAAEQLGSDAYEYAALYRGFRPLLERLGTVIEVDRPESRLDYALHQARARGLTAMHVSFLPLHHIYLSSLSANVAVLSWAWSDLPNADLDNDTRNNWVRIADRLSLILCASQHTGDAFVRAGVRTPLRTISAPLSDALFELPLHLPTTRCRLQGPAYVCARPDAAPIAPDPWAGPRPPSGVTERTLAWAGAVYARRLAPRTPSRWRRSLDAGVRVARASYRAYLTTPEPPSNASSVDLSGVVYASVIDPTDGRSNWQDLLSAFCVALRSADDATLVVWLDTAPRAARQAAHELLDYHRGLGADHRCRVVVMPQPPTEQHMLTLASCATYALSASRAEGVGLAIRQLLAAARPAVAPQHSALGEYVDAAVGFPVASHPEPTHWARDPARRLTTTWHRIVWQSLHDQIQASYRVATAERERYAQLANCARDRMRDSGATQRTWLHLRDALEVDEPAAAVR